MPVFLQTLDFSSSILNSPPTLNLIHPHGLALGKKACAPYQLVTPFDPPTLFWHPICVFRYDR